MKLIVLVVLTCLMSVVMVGVAFGECQAQVKLLKYYPSLDDGPTSFQAELSTIAWTDRDVGHVTVAVELEFHYTIVTRVDQFLDKPIVQETKSAFTRDYQFDVAVDAPNKASIDLRTLSATPRCKEHHRECTLDDVVVNQVLCQ